ncbi:carboxymuconolactone decarboxylase family protein [Mucilaginibacter polytrichastri]|nr:carboxymuconolactone decarboxylase family protein [Mucilaginibacter polytrichastri]SFS39920.1 alkylhydroperoxidase AhpD family core domain-containing protein [Mucilaginibacter polytrichastri]
MSTRTKINQKDPAYHAMMALGEYLTTTPLTAKHHELIKIRTSQINGCAFCIDMHTRDARKEGETEQRIYALSVWRDTPFFDEQERALLALTEEVTLIGNHVSDDTYNKAAAVFEPAYLTAILMAIIAINSWNRFAITTHMEDFLKVG